MNHHLNPKQWALSATDLVTLRILLSGEVDESCELAARRVIDRLTRTRALQELYALGYEQRTFRPGLQCVDAKFINQRIQEIHAEEE